MKLVIETDKTKAEIRGIIAENTSEFSKNPFFSVGCEYFNGKISEDSFKIRRNISYRNNGLPEINGKIQEITDQNGSKRTKITISIAPMPIIQFITVLWCAVSAFFFRCDFLPAHHLCIRAVPLFDFRHFYLFTHKNRITHRKIKTRSSFALKKINHKK